MSSKIARDIFSHALEAVLPQNFMKNSCTLDGDIFTIEHTKYNLSKYKNIYVFGSGKAAYSMAKEIENILGDKIYKGLVVAPSDALQLETIEVKEGSHPIPTQKSLAAAESLLHMMQECEEDDLYIYLLSGGSSALIEVPIAPISLEELQVATDLMLSNTLEIQEINTVRKHISQIKGGRLAQECLATGVVLVLSDVIGDDLYSIGSAPLYADSSSFRDAKEILENNDIYVDMPESIQHVIHSGIKGNILESPFGPLQRVTHHIVASNEHAKQAANKYARSIGLDVKVFKDSFSGEVSQVIKNILKKIQYSEENCLIFGGECTVNVTGHGQGGRNQHAVLLALKEMQDKNQNITFLSAGTDGIDGNSDAAGAVVDLGLLEKVDVEKMQNHLTNYDSYNFFKELDALVMTGATGTNVIDLIIIIKGNKDV